MDKDQNRHSVALNSIDEAILLNDQLPDRPVVKFWYDSPKFRVEDQPVRGLFERISQSESRGGRMPFYEPDDVPVVAARIFRPMDSRHAAISRFMSS